MCAVENSKPGAWLWSKSEDINLGSKEDNVAESVDLLHIQPAAIGERREVGFSVNQSPKIASIDSKSPLVCPEK